MLLSLHPNIIVHVENVAAINFLRPYSVASWSASPELPKFAEMLLENDVAFITP